MSARDLLRKFGIVETTINDIPELLTFTHNDIEHHHLDEGVRYTHAAIDADGAMYAFTREPSIELTTDHEWTLGDVTTHKFIYIDTDVTVKDWKSSVAEISYI